MRIIKKRFRTGPSEEDFCDSQGYFVDDGTIQPYYVPHREDGPADEDSDGTQSWWWHGERVYVSSQEQFERWLKYNKF